MTRFPKVFLREPLNGKVHVAGFGKHPAWDDHIDDLGLDTETLVLTKQLLYSQGIATQLASGAWDQIEKSRNAIEFNHRFCWSRKCQTIAGAIWASSDGKGRTRFPMIICAQADFEGWRAIDQLLGPIDQMGMHSKSAKTPTEFRELLTRLEVELFGLLRSSPGGEPSFEMSESQQISILPELVTLAAGLKTKAYRGWHESVRPNGSHFRMASSLPGPGRNLSFWSAYLAALEIPSSPPCLAIAADGKPWVDLIVGEPVDNDFFCLRANQTALPATWLEIGESDRRKVESAARGFLQASRLGHIPPAAQQRSWWTSLFTR
jgi:hypothetical protein